MFRRRAPSPAVSESIFSPAPRVGLVLHLFPPTAELTQAQKQIASVSPDILRRQPSSPALAAEKNNDGNNSNNTIEVVQPASSNMASSYDEQEASWFFAHRWTFPQKHTHGTHSAVSYIHQTTTPQTLSRPLPFLDRP